MLPIQLAGLVLVGRALVPKSRSFSSPSVKNNLSPFLGKRNTKSILPQRAVPSRVPIPDASAAIRALYNGLTGAVSQITSQITSQMSKGTEDYNAVVKSFMPGNAELLIPRRPSGSAGFHFADLDGSSQNGLIASFKLENEIRTLYLKKKGEEWYKEAEVSSYGFDTLDFRGTADLTGEGKKQLLLGVSSGNEMPTLYSYSLSDGVFTELFARSYDRLEVLPAQKTRNTYDKVRLAIWNKRDENSYDIEILRWNGSELVPVKNPASYYYNRVAPYYFRKVKQAPGDVHLWYNLAEALEKAGAYKDALIAVNAGMRNQMEPSLKDRYLELKKTILDEAHSL
ncbi:hypothetical protein V6C42_07190 [Pseudoclostridium thermosuccinogenes]|uniref:hypothetical protein n=1 Tax=Clostridium thermosuccinogenes TaxID=84032 RepID=UPI002FD93467